MNALIFGAGGQDGYYLGRLCTENGITGIGVSRSGPGTRGDVSSFTQVRALVRKYKPAYIFHLAARSTTRHDALFENHAAIATGTLNVLEAARLHSPESRIFITGSAVQFENRGDPIGETCPFAATSPYAVARIQSVYAARYFRTLGLKVYVGYLFHHESPLRQPEHVSQMVARAAARIGRGSREILSLGDISVEKEWTFAGDTARAILALAGQDRVTEAVIGSGTAYSIERWLEECFGVIGADWRSHVRTREGFVPEYRRLVSDPAVIRSLGWEPETGLQELAEMMVSAAQKDLP